MQASRTSSVHDGSSFSRMNISYDFITEYFPIFAANFVTNGTLSLWNVKRVEHSRVGVRAWIQYLLESSDSRCSIVSMNLCISRRRSRSTKNLSFFAFFFFFPIQRKERSGSVMNLAHSRDVRLFWKKKNFFFTKWTSAIKKFYPPNFYYPRSCSWTPGASDVFPKLACVNPFGPNVDERMAIRRHVPTVLHGNVRR